MGSAALFGTRILVVDDDSAFAELLNEELSALGYVVVVASRPSEALVRLSEATFEVAVLDLGLPEMGGLELARRIKLESPDTQLVVLTGIPDLESAIEGMREGTFDYFQKGALRIFQLERSIRGAAEKRRLTIQNRGLVDQLAESNQMLASLHEVTRELTGELDVDRVLQRVVRSARTLLEVEVARLLLFQLAAGGELVIETAVGDGADTLRGLRLNPTEGIAAVVAQSQQAVLLPVASAHPAYLNRVDRVDTELPGFACAPIRHGAVRGVLVVAGRSDLRQEHCDLLATLGRQAGVAIQNALHSDRAINFFVHASEILVTLLERLDPHHAGRPRDTAALADLLSRRAGLSDADRRAVHFGTLLRDIGRIGLPAELLRTESTLDRQQQSLAHQHPTLGLDLLRPISAWQDVLPIVHAHHEHWDGSGHPLGLAGDEIPLGARVVAIAEAFDLLTSHSAGGSRFDEQQALAELERGSGIRFDPQLVRLFVAEYRRHGDPRQPPAPSGA